MQTQYEVNNFSRVTFLSKLNYFSFSIARDWPLYNLQNAIEGPSQNVSSIWNAKDQRSPIITWKPKI
jgi:hypothetical protein